jgi:hypothetical protein
MKRLSVALGSALCLMFMITFFAQVSSADMWDKKTRITVDRPWSLPGNTVLPAGTYVMRLYDSASDRHLVEIMNEDETKLLARVIGIPAVRLQPSNETVLNFYERKTPGPDALQSWFYPGTLNGVEFPAPPAAAAELATIDVNALPAPPEAPPAIAEVQPEPAPVPEVAPEPAPEPEPAPQPEPEPAPAQIAENNPPPPPALPKTAGELPLIALIGLASLGASTFFRK